MIGFLLELAAFQVGMDCAHRHAANKARRKYVKAVEAQWCEFIRWAAKNPHHPLVQQVNAEGLALNQCLTITPAERAEKTLAICQNAHRLMQQVQVPVRASVPPPNAPSLPWPRNAPPLPPGQDMVSQPKSLPKQPEAPSKHGCLWWPFATIFIGLIGLIGLICWVGQPSQSGAADPSPVASSTPYFSPTPTPEVRRAIPVQPKPKQRKHP